MDEEKKSDIMATDATPAPASPPAPEPPLTWRDGTIPLLALGMAWLFWACFGLENLTWPHLGILALVCAHFAAVLIALGRRVHISVGSLFCTAAALALALSCALYASAELLLMNCLVILLTAATATFALSGHLEPGRSRALGDAVALSFIALFSRVDRPFRSLGQLRRQKGGAALGRAALAVLVTVPVLAVVLWLLSSADAVFGSLLDPLRVDFVPGRTIWRILRIVLAALFIASALCFIREEPPHRSEKPAGERRAAAFLPVTVLLDIVYLVFCTIQLKYLFGGAEAASMAGGWAEYARSGFFQLAAVAAIDLGLVLLGTDGRRFASRGGKLLRAAFALLLVLTAVILFSAFWRMRLYILAFGMSMLRLLTLWAMAAIAAGILAAGWKLIRPAFRAVPAAGAFALTLWCVMCLANPCGMVARYNVNGYMSGSLSQLDADYLARLGPDVLPALPPLQQAGAEGQDAFDGIVRQLRHTNAGVPWTQWSLSGYRSGLDAGGVAQPVEFETGEHGGYKTILWDGRTYAPYGTLAAGRIALGEKLGCLRQDEEVMIYAVGTADTDFWLAEYTDEGWMDDPPLVYRALDAPDDVPVPEGVDSLGYDIWQN